ncbi:MAG: sulfite exporter TauE/SafE family protein [Chloroflexota bacterium]|nr:sulfite exporter TauE/SafE family protein [Chloroflexota bacterium]
MGTADLLILVLGLCVAGFAKGTAGMGLPLIATPILAGVFGPRAAVVIVTIPIFVANTLLVVQGWRRIEVLRGLWPILVASMIGTAIGVNLLALLDQRTFAILISLMVAVFLFRGERLLGDPAARRARAAGTAVGFVSGVLQGTTSIAAPLIGSYLHARRLEPGDYVVAVASVFQLNAIVQLVGYALLALYTPEIVTIGLISLVPTLLALMAGIYFRSRLDQSRFRQVIVVLLVLSVANLLWRSFGP